MGLMKAVKHAPPKDASPTNPALALAKLGIMYHLHPLYIQYQSTATHLDCRFCLRLRPAAHASCDLCVPSLISNVLDSQGHHGKGNIVTYGLHAVLFNFESFLLNGSLEWDGI